MSPLRRMLYLDTCVWLPDDLLMKADKITMSSALELRVPLLDHRLAEYAWSLPDGYKLRGDQGKWLLRRAARGRVPEGDPHPAQAGLRDADGGSGYVARSWASCASRCSAARRSAAGALNGVSSRP